MIGGPDRPAPSAIACGTVTVRELEPAVNAYQRWLHQELVEVGEVSSGLAAAWGVSALTGARYALLRTPAGRSSVLRLVEAPVLASYTPAVSLGWNAFEITVQNVFELAEHLADSPFRIVGPPKEVDGFTSFIPMQVFGPNGEVLFLNEVRHSDDDTDLPAAQGKVAEIFIVVLASPDRQASANEYAELLQFDIGGTHNLRYGLVNRAFGFPQETVQTITMVQQGRSPFLQVDQYPPQALVRKTAAGTLPTGNALVSVRVDSLDSIPLQGKTVGPVARPGGFLYAGRRVRVVRGLAGELIELIEVGHDGKE